jgi:SAM-dependent methyltransferase
MVSLSLLIQRIPQTVPAADLGPYLDGARLFHAAADGERIWLADFSDNLFLSPDGRAFHELRVVERNDACILTDTPGFVPALAAYHERGVLLFLSAPGSPLEMRRVFLERIPAGTLLREAAFFALSFPQALEKGGPRLVAATRDRDDDRMIRKLERRTADLDHGRLQVKVRYVLDRGLKECSDFSKATPFGEIREKMRERVSASLPHRSEPLRILTIGPGHGRMEAELKDLFGETITIDTFSLTDVILPEHRPAFSTVYLGNIDTHRLPEGYDLILSFFGSSYAVDQRRVLEQVVDALRPGGEAFLIDAGDLFLDFESETPRRRESRYLEETYSLLHRSTSDSMAALVRDTRVEFISLRKEKPCPPAKTMLDEAARAANRFRGIRYVKEAGVPAGLLEDEEGFSRDQWEVFLDVARRRGFALDPSATAEDLAAFRERLLRKCRRKAWEVTKNKVAMTTLEEAVDLVWQWVEWQDILAGR